MTYREFDELRRRVDQAEMEVILAAQRIVMEWKACSNSCGPVDAKIASCAAAIEDLEKVYAELPPGPLESS